MHKPSVKPVINYNILHILRTIFAVDIRALALFRIVLGSLIAFDLLHGLQSSVVFYSDLGVLPRATLLRESYRDGNISLFLFGGSPEFVYSLFAIHLLVTLTLIAGFKTRTSTILCWLFLISQQNRNPLVNHGGDMLFRLLTFWGMFLPLGHRWSLDSWLISKANTDKQPQEAMKYFSIATIAIMLQMVIVYVFTSQLKTGASWHDTGQAMSLALRNQEYSTTLGQWLAKDFNSVLRVGTTLTLIGELVLPLMLLTPIRTTGFRVIGLAGLFSLHIGIDLFMKVGMISIVSMAGLIVFIPSQFFDYRGQKKNVVPGYKFIEDPMPKWASLCCAVCLIYVMLFNLKSINYPFASIITGVFPQSFKTVLRLDQKWNMFSPDPPKSQGYILPLGYLNNGEIVNLRNQEFMPEQSNYPRYIEYGNDWRWQKYSKHIREEAFQVYRQELARMLLDSWNRDKTTSGALYANQVKILLVHTSLESDTAKTTMSSLGEFSSASFRRKAKEDILNFIHR